MAERKKRRLEWWKKRLDEKEKREHKEDVAAASKRRKQMLDVKDSGSTKKRKRSSARKATTSTETPSLETHHVVTDQNEFPSKCVVKSRYTLFVGNLPYDATRETLREHFGKAGSIDAIRLLTTKDSGLSRGCAFVDFTDSQSYVHALQLHHSIVGDRKINVEATCGGGGQSKQRRKKLDDKKRKWKHKIQQQIQQRKTTKL